MADMGARFTNKCSACGETYKVQEVNTGPWSWQNKDIECPYCKTVSTKRSSGSFQTTKLGK